MTVTKNRTGSKLTVTLTGRLDNDAAPVLEKELKPSLDGVTNLCFDFAGIEYISSAGLRVLLFAQKIMELKGNMKILNVTPAIIEVFEVTGFSDILDIEVYSSSRKRRV